MEARSIANSFRDGPMSNAKRALQYFNGSLGYVVFPVLSMNSLIVQAFSGLVFYPPRLARFDEEEDFPIRNPACPSALS
jgi:hypothetical protein